MCRRSSWFSRAITAIASAVCVGLSLNALADEPEPVDLAEQGAQAERDPYRLAAIWENDGGYLRPGGPDRHYTNGLLVNLACQPRWADGVADALSLPYDSTAAGFVAGQLMFTPENITLPVPDPTDRPYAGYLFGGVYWQRDHHDSLDHVQLDMGVVGPSSSADEVQDWIHNNFNGDTPRGWGSQVPDEYAIQLTYRKKWRIELDEASRDRGGMQWQLIPEAGFALGTVYRHVEAGAVLRYGWNLPGDYGPQRVADVGSATDLRGDLAAAEQAQRGRWSWYLFSRAAVRLVQHNLFIDGSEVNDSAGVNSEPIVGEFQVGVKARQPLGKFWAVEIGYAQTLLTDEFEGQDTLDGYGTLMLALRGTW